MNLDILIKNIPVIVGVLTSIASLIKSLGLFESERRQVSKIKELSSLLKDLESDNSKKDIEKIIEIETKRMKEKSVREFDPGGVFAIMVLSTILGIISFGLMFWFNSSKLIDIWGWISKIISGVLILFMFMVFAVLFTHSWNDLVFKKDDEKKEEK